MELGFRNFSNSKRPIQTEEDLKGLKIRGCRCRLRRNGSRWESTPPASAGTTVYVPAAETLTARSTYHQLYTEKFYEAQVLVFDRDVIFTISVAHANEDFMNSLSVPTAPLSWSALRNTRDYNHRGTGGPERGGDAQAA
ncbi:MAG: hypothetical protein ACLTW9_00030 [Enterocloster sp.]